MSKGRRQSRLQLFRARAERIEQRLRTLSFAELDAAMSSETTARQYASHIFGSQILPIAERPNPDTIQVVVQGFLPCRWCVGSHVHVAGFRRYRDGRLENMSDKELYAYD